MATNWGQTIFQSTNEMVNNAIMRERVAQLQAKGRADREWWDKERESISTKFMQELDEVPTASSKAASTGAGTSDEEAILVEAGGPATGGSTKGGTVKKRKGKK